jgi:hypothetical protein
MEYEGKLYSKIGRRYYSTVETAGQLFERIIDEFEKYKNEMKEIGRGCDKKSFIEVFLKTNGI